MKVSGMHANSVITRLGKKKTSKNIFSLYMRELNLRACDHQATQSSSLKVHIRKMHENKFNEK